MTEIIVEVSETSVDAFYGEIEIVAFSPDGAPGNPGKDGIDGTDGTDGTDGAPGLKGETGDGISKRHDYVATGYGVSYCGVAITGSADSDPVWRITRITVQSNGSTVTAIAVNVAWTNRLSVTYA